MRALITGINGMDGSHLADFLLEKDYEVFGMERRSSVPNRANTKHLDGKITFLTGDLADQHSIVRCLKKCNPNEVYNLAAQSFVGASWNIPEQTGDITGIGVLRVLEAVREYNQSIKVYQASTSEMFGQAGRADENTSFHPRSPYGAAKVYGHHVAVNYRESYGMHVVCGICFNHESERRGFEFVTRKISHGVAMIKKGFLDYISLGNLGARRDWGYAPDYVRAMWLIMQQSKPGDFVVCTEENHSVRDFLDIAFWEIGINRWDGYVKQDPAFMRPAEIDSLLGSSEKIRRLGWMPSVGFEEMVIRMVKNDISLSN